MRNFLKNHKQEIVLGILICVYITYFSIASFQRYDNFYTGRFDLGNMDQTVWNTINGRVFQMSNDYGLIVSRLSVHADFMLILLSPFYLLWSHPKTLLLIQTIILSLGACFVFLIAKETIKSKNFALVFGFLFLMNPLPQFTNLYDFHAVSLATTLLLASFYFLIKGKYLLLILFLLLSGITKEQVWIITSLFGFPLLFQKTKKVKFLGIGILFFSLVFFGYLVEYAIPQNLGAEHFALSYFSNFGNTPTEVTKNVFFSPQKVISIIFEESRINYLKQLFAPLGFLPLISPLHLIFAIPGLLINLLSNNRHFYEIYYQYTSTITPFIFISAIYAVKKILRRFPTIPKLYIITYFLVFTLSSAYFFGPLPGAKHPNIDMFIRPQNNKDVIENFLSKIPEKYAVAATNNLGSHLSRRQQISTIPFGIDKADIVVFLIDGNSASPSLNAQREIVNNLKLDKDYAEIFEIDNFTVFKKQEILL